jgi:hypothetical protein
MQVEETTKKRLLYRSGAGSQKVGPSDLRRSHWYSTVQYSTNMRARDTDLVRVGHGRLDRRKFLYI